MKKTKISDIPKKMKKDKRKYYRLHPIKFMVEILDVDPKNVWDMMRAMCEVIRDNRKTVIKAGHSVSKTYTMARIILWFLYCWCPSTVITTAPTHTQVEELLWREINEAFNNARVPLGGHLTKTELDLQKIKNKKGKVKRWFAFGFSTKPDQGQEHATKMQGFHNKYVLVVFDEADGILPAIWKALYSLLTGKHVKFVGIGNPLKPTGEFPDCFKDSSYAHLTISVLDTPNYKQGKEVIPGLSGREYEADMRKKWGVKSPMYQSRVLGQIPDSDPMSIVPVSWYEKAEDRILKNPSGKIKRFVTVDVADGGTDDTVVKGWENKKQIKEWRYPGKRADEVDADVLRNVKEINGNAIIYDNDGCGRILGGLLRGMIKPADKIKIIPFTGSDPAYDDAAFKNRRAEGHFCMHVDFRDNLISVLPGNRLAKEDVTSVRWDTKRKGNRHGKIDVEAKPDLKKRLSRSPDDGDDIMMMSACYDEVEVIEVHDMYQTRSSKKKRSWIAA